MHEIVDEVEIGAPPEVVWTVLTEPQYVAKWFAERVEIELSVGGAGLLAFNDEHVYPIEVVALDAPRRFSYRWMHTDGERPTEENSVLVEFELTPVGPGTLLTVRESGVDRLGWGAGRQAAYAEDHRSGWANFLARLAAYAPDALASPTPA